MLSWIDRRLRQASGLLDEIFGGYSVVLVSDISQLSPISDKALFHSKLETDIALLGYCTYHSFKHVVKLELNQ